MGVGSGQDRCGDVGRGVDLPAQPLSFCLFERFSGAFLAVVWCSRWNAGAGGAAARGFRPRGLVVFTVDRITGDDGRFAPALLGDRDALWRAVLADNAPTFRPSI